MDLKLQLEADWGTWKANTSPFVYHIPVDTYLSPEMIAAEEASKKQKEAAAEKKAEMAEEEAKAKKEKEEKDVADKEKKKSEEKRKQAMATDFNKVKPAPKGDAKVKWEKDWLEKNKSRKF